MSAIQTAAATDLEKVVRRVLREIWAGENPDALEELYTPDYVRHDPAAPGIVSHAGVRKLVKIYRDAFPDMRITLKDESICYGSDRLSAQYWIEGTHTGKFFQIEPCHRGLSIQGVGIWRIKDGRLAEDWHTFDAQTFFTALGCLPCIGELLEDH